MKASSKRYCLTPKGEFYLIGYGPKYASRLAPAKGVHDDIFAETILLETNGKKVFIFNADYIEFEENFCTLMKKTMNEEYGIDENLVLFSATHNHSSVMDYHKNWSTGVFNQEYYDFLIYTVKSGYEECLVSLDEVEAFYGMATVVGYYGSRIHYGELADNDVILIELRNKEDRVVAAICNWATHSTVISPENDLLTADFAGNVANKLYALKGYYPTMIVGAAGDSSNRAQRQGYDFEELERVSTGVANEIAKIMVDKKLEICYESDEFLTHKVNYKPEFNHEDIEAKIAEYEKEQEKETDADKIKVLYDRARALKRKLTLTEVDVTLYATIIKMNDLEIVTIPSELGSRFGNDIKNLSKAKVCLIAGYTNGHHSYLLPPELYGLSFETLGSVYRPSDVVKYVDKIKANL